VTTKQIKVKEISRARLRAVALWYLERYGGTRARVDQLLQRRIFKAEETHGVQGQAQAWKGQVLDELERLGLINDQAFAEARVRKGLRQGRSQRHMAQDLARAGVGKEVVEAAMGSQVENPAEAELHAARAYARQRRLGAYSRQDSEVFLLSDQERLAQERKDLARLGRRGFSYEIARRALAGEEGEA